MAKIKIATTNISVTFDKKKNVEKMVKMAKEAAANGADIVAFSEQAVQGYFHALVGPLTTDIIKYHQQNAETVPEGDSVQTMIQAAKENDIYIVFGMTERDKFYYDVLYNTAVLVGPEGFIGSYRKVHQPVDEKHIYSRGDDLPVFDTPIGRIGLQICMDKYFPEATREMVLKGAEIVFELAAWETFIGDGLEVEGKYLADAYDVLDVARASENQIFFISSNMVGKNEMGNFCGNANIVHPCGVIMATCGPEEEGIVYAQMDVREEIMNTRATFLMTWVKERNPHAYKTISAGENLQGLTDLQSRENLDTAEKV